MKDVVKRKGHKEPYDPEKVCSTCYRACLNAHLTEAEADRICRQVEQRLHDWLRDKHNVTSDDIFIKVTHLLALENEAAAFMYETHRDII
jgi:transcriptional regulator NrdR family protein